MPAVEGRRHSSDFGVDAVTHFLLMIKQTTYMVHITDDPADGWLREP